MSTNCSSDNNFAGYKKPWFTIEFTAKQLGLDIRVNDIPVFNIDNTGFMTIEVPVNQFIINGDNEISVITHPLFDDDDEQMSGYIQGASIDVSLYLREEDEPSGVRRLISSVSISPGNAYIGSLTEPIARFIKTSDKIVHSRLLTIKDAEVLDYPGYGNYKKQVITSWIINNVATSFPRWEWQSGVQIRYGDKSYQSLLKSYRSLYKAFEKNDLESVKTIVRPHSRERAIAFHLNNVDAGFENLSLGKFINHPTKKLHTDLFLEYTKFDIIGNGKLARIISAAQTQPIAFVDSETGQPYLPQFMWYLNKNNEWILIR